MTTKLPKPSVPIQTPAKKSKYNNTFKNPAREPPMCKDSGDWLHSTDRFVRMSFIEIRQSSIRSYFTWQLGRI